MRFLALFLTLAFLASSQSASCYDPNFSQKVKYNQSRTNWKIKESRERMKKKKAERERERARRYNSSSSSKTRSYSSSYSRSSSSSKRSGSSDYAASGSPAQALQQFISVANRATRIEHLYPYSLKGKVKYWRRLSAKDKQKALMKIKQWSYHSRVLGVTEKKRYASTVKLGGGAAKGAHLWAEDGRWKYSDVIIK